MKTRGRRTEIQCGWAVIRADVTRLEREYENRCECNAELQPVQTQCVLHQGMCEHVEAKFKTLPYACILEPL